MDPQSSKARYITKIPALSLPFLVIVMQAHFLNAIAKKPITKAHYFAGRDFQLLPENFRIKVRLHRAIPGIMVKAYHKSISYIHLFYPCNVYKMVVPARIVFFINRFIQKAFRPDPVNI